jgi:hypothetical protein
MIRAIAFWFAVFFSVLGVAPEVHPYNNSKLLRAAIGAGLATMIGLWPW